MRAFPTGPDRARRSLRVPAAAVAVIGLLVVAASAAATSAPYHWSERSRWTTIALPHTPALYVRLFEPRSEVIGELGAPRTTQFICRRPCDRLLAGQYDEFGAPGSRWDVLFAPRKRLSEPRLAALITGEGDGWEYVGLHAGERTGGVWRQHRLPCHRSMAVVRRRARKIVFCETRRSFERRGHKWSVEGAVFAWPGARVRYIEVLAAPLLGNGRTNTRSAMAVRSAARAAEERGRER